MPIQLPETAQRVIIPYVEKQTRAAIRRWHLANILLRERYLTREALMFRVESIMGFASFGENNRKGNFYRDMCVVKAALKQIDFDLKFSRSMDKPGYYFAGEDSLHPDVKKEIAGALDEIDQEQIEIYKRISPAQKFYQACSIINLAKKVSLGEGTSEEDKAHS